MVRAVRHAILVLGLITWSRAQTTSHFNAETDVRIVSSSFSGIELEIQVPDPEIKTDAAGKSLHLPGYSATITPGFPAMLVRGFPVALPPQAQPSLRVLHIEEQTEFIGQIAPAPSFQNESQNPDENDATFLYVKDENAYRANLFLPETNLSLGAPSTMRNLEIVSLLFHPIRYNPASGEIKRVTTIRCAVDFQSSAAASAPITTEHSEPFNTIFGKTVINYHQAKNWSAPRRRLNKQSAYFLQEGDEWLKIYTDRAGLYKISGEELQAAGLSITDVNPQNLRLFNQGEEVALRVATDNNTMFTSDDYIEFVARAFKNESTTSNVYWLTVSDHHGKRMRFANGAPADAPTLSFGEHIISVEKDFFHIANFPGHTDQEHWFMDSLFAPATKRYAVDLGAIARTENIDASFTLGMLGYAANINVQPDHHTVVKLNDQLIYEKWWDGRVTFADSVQVASSILQDGVNLVEITGPADTDNKFLDWQVIDYFKLRYHRENITEKDSLAFTINKTGRFTIDARGFSDAAIFVYDISDPNDPVMINGSLKENDQLLFDYSTTTSRFLLVSDAFKNHPTKIVKDENSRWRDPLNSVDYLVIAYDEFAPEVAPLASFHQANGRAVAVVKVQDVYDEFGYGLSGKRPIKDFLAYAYENWVTAPSFLLLVGDASWNPRRLRPELESYGAGRVTDFVPTHLFEADVEHAQATSDSWFACFDGENDVLPDMLVGRLPARSRIETQYMVQKILDYATRFEKGDWQKTATFVADVGEGGANAFEDSSDAYIRTYLPADFIANRVYLSSLGLAPTRAAIKKAFEQGCLTLNYFGHGAVALWAKQIIFSNQDIPNLQPNRHLPFLFTMSCINGYFADPNPSASALGELLMTAEGKGALAVFTGSGKAFASTLQPLAHQLYYALYTENDPYVGAFTNAGLLNMFATYPASTDHVRFYVLFGDPATRLHYSYAGDAKNYGWFSGSVDFKGMQPPAESQLAAYIDDLEFSRADIKTDDGTFGPLYISEDDSTTPAKEGGAVGDSISFRVLLPGDSLQLLKPRLPWRLGETANINLYVEGNRVARLLDVDFFVDVLKVGEQFVDGDPLAKNSTIYVEIKNIDQNTVATNDFVIFINDQQIPEQNLLHVSPYDPSLQKIVLGFVPNELTDGEYEFSLRPTGAATLASDHSFRFTISSTLQLKSVVNFPNPFAESTRFTFLLFNDTAADLSIKIYTVAGRLIRTIHSSADIGYNEIPWDGRDDFGDRLANGVYFYKLSANDGIERLDVIERLVVMQ